MPLALFALVSTACGDDDDTGTETSDTAGTTGDTGGTGDTTDTDGTGDTADTADTGDTGDTGPTDAGAFDETARRGCDPLVTEHCLLPFPSSHFLKTDTATATGVRLWFSPEAFPKNGKKVSAYTPEYDRLDGFSPASQILTVIPGVDLEKSGAADYLSIDKSIAATTPTIILDVETGEFVPHFAELDRQIESKKPDDDSPQLLYLRPARRLGFGKRFIVAFRSLKDSGGAALAATGDFKTLIDGGVPANPAVAYRKPRFDDLFATLAAKGVARESIVQAWDFTTATQNVLTTRMKTITTEGTKLFVDAIDGKLAGGSDDPGELYVIDSVEDRTPEQDPYIRRHVGGRFRVPLFVTTDEVGARLLLDESGEPRHEGWGWADFEVNIPHSAVGAATPHRLVQYGHGLLQNTQQIDEPYHQRFINEQGFVMYACDWWGLSRADLSFIATDIVTDLSNFPVLPERKHQGVLNHIILDKLMLGPLGQEDAFKIDNKPVADFSTTYFYGNSLGHIMGEVFMAMTPDVTRGVLGVGGLPFSFMLTRSVDFKAFFVIMAQNYPRLVDQLVMLETIQLLWNAAEPSAYVGLADDAGKKLLLYDVANDAQVPNLATDVLVRTHGFKHLQPVNRTIWGIEQVDSSGPNVPASGFVDVECGADPVPVGNIADAENGAHYCFRQKTAGHAMFSAFLRENGQITWTCDGPCDPE